MSIVRSNIKWLLVRLAMLPAWVAGFSLISLAQTSYHIGMENGLSTNVLTTIITDQNGYMWMGSYNGLLNHQGARIRVYNKVGKDAHALSGSEMNALCNDRQGKIWIGTTGGLDCLDPVTATIRHYPLKTTPTSPSHLGYIYAIFEDYEHYIWISSDEAIFRLDPASGQFTAFYEGTDKDHVPATATGYRQGIGDERGFWISTSEGLAYYDYRQHTFLHRHNSNNPVFALDQSTNGSANSDICADDAGNIYFVAGGDKLVRYQLRTGRFEVYSFVHPPGSWNCCYSLARDFKGNIWIGFRHGGILLFNTSDRTFTPIRKEMHNRLLRDNFVHALCEDYQHHMWVTTDEGIDVIDYYQQGLQQYCLSDVPDFKKLQYAAGIMSDDGKGHLYIPFMNGSLFRFDYHKDSISETVLSPDKEKRITYIAPLQDGSAEVYYAHGSVRVTHPLQDESLKEVQQRNPANSIPKGFTLWSATIRGVKYVKLAAGILERITDTSVQHLDCPGYMKQTCISQDSNYLYFINSQPNLVRQHIKTGMLKTYDLQPLIAAAGFAFCNVRDLTDDGAGNIWMTAQNGLLRYNIPQHQLSVFTTSQGLSHNFTYSLLTDHKGVVWVCSFGGIDWYDKASNTFQNAIKYPDGTYMDAFGSSVKTADGTLYFLSGNKLARIHPETFLPAAVIKPRLLINEILINGIQVNGPKAPRLQALSRQENRVLFRYGLLDYNRLQSNLRLQYRLDGIEKNWTEDGRTEVAYNGLPPGQYTFMVRALTPDGKVMLNSAPILFHIHPAFWQTWWARLLLLLLIAGVIYLLFKRRVRAIQQKVFLKQQMIELESRALQSQMNPHFIFNSLNAIQELVIREDSTAAYQYLSKFSKLLRMVLLHSEHRLIPLTDELEMYRLYLSLEKLRFNHSFHYNIVVEEGVDEDALQIPPLLLQPYLENAIWHGLMHKKEEKILEIRFSESREYIICSITDNGIGRAAAAERQRGRLRAKGDTSKGMNLSQDRIALLNKDSGGEGGIVIHDLRDEAGQPTGTRVVVTLAINDTVDEL
jgi:ligand-binding sensor domain-containing protein/anti-sigma regulatory factor (Ser/Thr protein kinase)